MPPQRLTSETSANNQTARGRPRNDVCQLAKALRNMAVNMPSRAGLSNAICANKRAVR